MGRGRGLGGGEREGVRGGGRGHFIHLAIYCTYIWCFALKGLRTIRGLRADPGAPGTPTQPAQHPRRPTCTREGVKHAFNVQHRRLNLWAGIIVCLGRKVGRLAPSWSSETVVVLSRSFAEHKLSETAPVCRVVGLVLRLIAPVCRVAGLVLRLTAPVRRVAGLVLRRTAHVCRVAGLVLRLTAPVWRVEGMYR